MQSRGYTMTEQSRGFKEDSYKGYLSPKNAISRGRQTYFSPGIDQRYPLSQKYSPPTPAPRPLISQQLSPSYEYDSSTVEVAELRLSLSQLKNSLQIANQNSQRLQEELFSERKKSYQLSQIKRRLEQELQKMQFQFQRMGNYQSLEERQTSIKLQTALRQNARMSQQVSDLIDESKELKQQQRKLMSEIDKLMHQRSALSSQNQELLTKLKSLEREVKEVKRQFQSQSFVLKGQTYRSQHVPTVINSVQSIPQQPEQIDYAVQSQKLLGDYQKLLLENESMKRLYKQFYKEGLSKQAGLFREQDESIRMHPSLPQIQEDKEARSFSNHRIAEKLNNGPRHDQSSGLKTPQKDELVKQLSSLRSQAVNQIKASYLKSVKQAQVQKKNALKVFMQQLNKNVIIFGKMAENYLELRANIKEQTGMDIPRSADGLIGEAGLLLQMYKSVKEKAKSQGGSGILVAIFRLLTLLVRCESLPSVLSENMQHSVLKYAYKLANPAVKQ